MTANRFLSNLDKQLQVADLNLTTVLPELKRFAKAKANECMRDTAHMAKEQALYFCKSKFSRYGFVLADALSITEALTQLRL